MTSQLKYVSSGPVVLEITKTGNSHRCLQHLRNRAQAEFGLGGNDLAKIMAALVDGDTQISLYLGDTDQFIDLERAPSGSIGLRVFRPLADGETNGPDDPHTGYVKQAGMTLQPTDVDELIVYIRSQGDVSS